MLAMGRKSVTSFARVFLGSIVNNVFFHPAGALPCCKIPLNTRSNGMNDMESRLSGRIDTALHEVRREVAHERDARKLLGEKVRQLEERPRATTVCGNVEETVDKSVVVIGGFAEDGLQQVEEMVREMLANVNGFKDVKVAGSNSNIALATFDSPMDAMKFIRNQRKHPVMISAQLWAAENRSRDERNRCRVSSKIKKFMIELRDHSAKDVLVSYKSFRVITWVNGKLVPTATVLYQKVWS